MQEEHYYHATHPALSWGYIKNWALFSGLPETTVLLDQNGRKLGDPEKWAMHLTLTVMGDDADDFTWGELLAYAAENQMPDDGFVRDSEGRSIRDLGAWQDRQDERFLTLQRTW